MATYEDFYTAATSESKTFKQICIAITRVARDIMAEDAGVPNHAHRVQWARNVILAGVPRDWTNKMIWSVLDTYSGTTDLATLTDVNIKNRVEAIVNEHAVG